MEDKTNDFLHHDDHRHVTIGTLSRNSERMQAGHVTFFEVPGRGVVTDVDSGNNWLAKSEVDWLVHRGPGHRCSGPSSEERLTSRCVYPVIPPDEQNLLAIISARQQEMNA